MTNSRGYRKRKFSRKRKRKIIYIWQCSFFRLALFCLALAASLERSWGHKFTFRPSRSPHLHLWRYGYKGHGTTHEQLGEMHWTPTEFTMYTSSVNYTQDPARNSTVMRSVYNITHLIFNSIFTDTPALPPGYIVVENQDTLALGPKVEQNEWKELLAEYWLILLWIFLLLVIIILMPFIGVFYCCFCCCRRCRPSCPPCEAKQNERRRYCCGICLAILIVGLIFGLIIAHVSNKLIDRGFDETAHTMRRGSVDTCAFLRDVADHIYHLFVYNYEELETHIVDQLNHADQHLFLDLAEVSESNALTELERIFNNMPQALLLMRQVDYLEKEMRFYGAQLRDALRGLKRDINFGTHNLCGLAKCYNLLPTRSVEFLDNSKCLHLDIIPNTTVFVEGIEEVIELRAGLIPKLAIERLQKLNATIKKHVHEITPKLIRNIQSGREIFNEQSTNIRNIIDAVTNDVYMNTLHSTKSFEDVYELFGTERTVISIIVLLLILLIICILIAGLICGCCGAKPSATATKANCSTATGAICLLIGILIIFCVISFILLVGLFYFVIGAITYEGACAPLRDFRKNALFQQFDKTIDLHRYIKNKTNITGDVGHVDPADANPEGTTEKYVLPPMRLSNAINACSENQSIFDMLRANKLYDVNDLVRIRIMPEEGEINPMLPGELDVLLFTDKDKADLNAARASQLAEYHSSSYVSHLCTKFTPISLITLGDDFAAMGDEVYKQWLCQATYSYRNDRVNAKAYQNTFVAPLTNIIFKIKQKLEKIDELILFENHDFGKSIDTLLNAVIRSEKFINERGKDFVNELGKNLTDTIRDHIKDYVEMVIRESNENVGHCAPLAYIYYTGVDLICRRLVDPLNGFWLGILLCAMLFLPILFVAHRLMCLYRTIYPAPVIAVVVLERGCPVCTGADYVPPPITTCGGGQQTYCGCNPPSGASRGGQKSPKRSRLSAGTLSCSDLEDDDLDFEIKVDEPPASKHKRD